MGFSEADVAAILLTLRLATTVTILLLFFGAPLAWWLARTSSRFKGPIGALIALPLVLPPTVLGAGPVDRFFSIALPMAKPGFFTAAVLGFAHTVGEFGVVLMIGGNIPGETRVVSVQIYDHVEALAYDQANQLALLMIIFSFLVLLSVYGMQKKSHRQVLRFSP